MDVIASHPAARPHHSPEPFPNQSHAPVARVSRTSIPSNLPEFPLLPRHALAYAILAVLVIALVGFAWRAWRLHKRGIEARWGSQRKRRK